MRRANVIWRRRDRWQVGYRCSRRQQGDDSVAPPGAGESRLPQSDEVHLDTSTIRPGRRPKAYQDTRFLESKDARALRILAEYLEPLYRFQRHHVQDTIVFMGSARLLSGP